MIRQRKVKQLLAKLQKFSRSNSVKVKKKPYHELELLSRFNYATLASNQKTCKHNKLTSGELLSNVGGD